MVADLTQQRPRRMRVLCYMESFAWNRPPRDQLASRKGWQTCLVKFMSQWTSLPCREDRFDSWHVLPLQVREAYV